MKKIFNKKVLIYFLTFIIPILIICGYIVFCKHTVISHLKQVKSSENYGKMVRGVDMVYMFDMFPVSRKHGHRERKPHKNVPGPHFIGTPGTVFKC